MYEFLSSEKDFDQSAESVILGRTLERQRFLHSVTIDAPDEEELAVAADAHMI